MSHITVYHVNSAHKYDRNIDAQFRAEFGEKTRFTKRVRAKMALMGIDVKRIEKLYPVLLK